MITLDRSSKLYHEMSRIVPGGVHSNFRFAEPHPLYFSKAEGPRIWDVDGNSYIDCVVNNGALILGHKHPKVVEAVRSQLEVGLTAAVETELSYRVSKLVTELVPSAEMVRFANSGTEAVMKALMMSRAYTGRDWIIKAEGCYHGWYDQVAISEFPPIERAGPPDSPLPVPESGGLLKGVEERTIVVPYNDADAVELALRKHGENVAALLIEPVAHNMGTVLPEEGYLKRLREITEQFGVLLIFDEVITGFRIAPGGAQQYFGVKPDLSVFAKAIANGFPLAAVAGLSDVISSTTPVKGNVGYAGTYNGHQVSLAAAEATLQQLRDGKVSQHLHARTKMLVDGFNEAAAELDVQARAQGIGGQFHTYFTGSEVRNYRDALRTDGKAYRMFRDRLLQRGVYFAQQRIFHHGITDAHDRTDLENILKGFREALAAVSKPIQVKP